MAEEPVHNPIAESRRQRRVLLLGVRAAFFLIILSVALLGLFAQKVAPEGPAEWIPPMAPLSLAVAVFAIALIIDLATPNKKLVTISGIFVGIIGGLVATYALTFLVDLIVESWIGEGYTRFFAPYTTLLKLMLGITLCYLGVTTVLQTQDDFRLVIPYVEFARQIRGIRPTILDTSALIDARIADIAATGLLQSTLIVPRFVLGELQTLADSADRLKRARGRRGLDVVARLQRQGAVGLSIDETAVPEGAVDQKLVELARMLSARLLTGDLGLARVAQIHGVQVLNLHEIANAFKPSLIAGQGLALRIVKPGEQAGQGVGYLEDGTMVVVEGGAAHIGDEVQVVVSSTMQTAAGRLIFARTAEGVEAPGASARTDGDSTVVELPETRIESPTEAESADQVDGNARPDASARRISGPRPAHPSARNPRR